MSAAVRGIKQIVKGQHLMEGAGVKVCRTVGTQRLRNLDPFLMLDELKSPAKDASAGFPDHPHRGFETCTIVLSGKVEHEDSVGNKGIIGPGGVQWMTAGRGIIHSEFPMCLGDELLWGFQLWINLPKKDKMCKPRYQDIPAERIPVVDKNGSSVRIMSGVYEGMTGPIELRNPGLLFDVRVGKGSTLSLPFPAHWNAFAYVYEMEGRGEICGQQAQLQHAHVIDNSAELFKASSQDSLKFMLFAAQPIKEPIVQHGPFVMNTQEEIYEAFRDYQLGRLQTPKSEMLTS